MPLQGRRESQAHDASEAESLGTNADRPTGVRLTHSTAAGGRCRDRSDEGVGRVNRLFSDGACSVDDPRLQTALRRDKTAHDTSARSNTRPNSCDLRGGFSAVLTRKKHVILRLSVLVIVIILMMVSYSIIVPNMIRDQVASSAPNEVQMDYLRVVSISSDSVHFDFAASFPKQSWIPFQIGLKAMKVGIRAQDEDIAYMIIPDIKVKLNRNIRMALNSSIFIPSEIRATMIEFVQTLSSSGISGNKWVITAPLTITMLGITWYKDLVVKKEIVLPEMRSTLESLWSALPDIMKVAIDRTHRPNEQIHSSASRLMSSITDTDVIHEHSLPPFVQPISFLPPVSIRSLNFTFTEMGPAVNTLIAFENPTVVGLDFDEIRFRVAMQDTWLGDMFVRNFSLQRGWNSLNVTAGVNLDMKHLSNGTVRDGLVASLQRLFSDIIARMSSTAPPTEHTVVKLSMMGPIYVKHPSRDEHAAFIHEVTEPLNILLPLDEILNSVNTEWIRNNYASLAGLSELLPDSSVKMRAASNIELGLRSIIHSTALPRIRFPYKLSVFVGSSFYFIVDGFYLTQFGTSMKLDTKFRIQPGINHHDEFTNVVDSYLRGHDRSLAITKADIADLSGSVLGWSGILSNIGLNILLPPLDMNWLMKALAVGNSVKDIAFDALELAVRQRDDRPGIDITTKWNLSKIFEKWGSPPTLDLVIRSMQFAFDIDGTIIMKVEIPRGIVFDSSKNNVMPVSFKTEIVECLPTRLIQRAVDAAFKVPDSGAEIGVTGFKIGIIDTFDRVRLHIPITQLWRMIGTLLEQSTERFVLDKISLIRIETFKMSVINSNEISMDTEASIVSPTKISLKTGEIAFALRLDGKQFMSMTVDPILFNGLTSRSSSVSGVTSVSLRVALADGNDEELAGDFARLVKRVIDQNLTALNDRISISDIIFRSHGTRPGIYCLKDVHFPLVGLLRTLGAVRQKHSHKFITWDPSKSPAAIDISPLFIAPNLEPLLDSFQFDAASVSTAPNHHLSCSVTGSSQTRSSTQFILPFFRFSMYLNKTKIVTAGFSSMLSFNRVDGGSRFSLKTSLKFNEVRREEMETVQDRVAMVGNWILDRIRDPELEYMVIEFKDVAFETSDGLANSNSLFRYTNISIGFRTLLEYEPDLVLLQNALKRHVKRLIAAQNVKTLNNLFQTLEPSITTVSLDVLPQRKAIIGFSGSLKNSLIPVNADIGYIRGSFSLGSSSSWLNATSRTGIKVLSDMNARQEVDYAIDLEVFESCLGRGAQPRPGFFALCGLEFGHNANDRITALRKLRSDLNLTDLLHFIDVGHIRKEIDEVVRDMVDATMVNMAGGTLNVALPTGLNLSLKRFELGFNTENDILLSLASILTGVPLSPDSAAATVTTLSGAEDVALRDLNPATMVLQSIQKTRFTVNIPFAEFTIRLDDKFLWRTRLAGLKFDTAVASEINVTADVQFSHEPIAQVHISQLIRDLSGVSDHGHRLVVDGWTFAHSNHDSDRIDVLQNASLLIPAKSVFDRVNTLFRAFDLSPAFDGFELQELSLTTLRRRRLRLHATSAFGFPLAMLVKIPFMEFDIFVGPAKLVEVSLNNFEIERRNATHMASTVILDLQFTHSTEQSRRDMANFLGRHVSSVFDVYDLTADVVPALTMTSFRFGNQGDPSIKLLSQSVFEVPMHPSLDSFAEHLVSKIVDHFVNVPEVFLRGLSEAATQTQDLHIQKFHLELIDEAILSSNVSLECRVKGVRMNLNVGYSSVTLAADDVPFMAISITDQFSVVPIDDYRMNVQLSGWRTYLYDSPEARTAFARLVQSIWPHNGRPAQFNADIQHVGVTGTRIGTNAAEDEMIDIFGHVRFKVSWILLEPHLRLSLDHAAEKAEAVIKDIISGADISPRTRSITPILKVDTVFIDYTDEQTIRMETITRVGGLLIDDLQINVPYIAAALSVDPDTRYPSMFTQWSSFEGYNLVANLKFTDTRMRNSILRTTINIVPNDNPHLWQHLIGDIAGDIIFHRNTELFQFIATNLTISGLQFGTDPDKVANSLSAVAINFGLRHLLHPLAEQFNISRPLELSDIQAKVTPDGVLCQVEIAPFRGILRAFVVRDVPSVTGWLYFRFDSLVRVDINDVQHQRGRGLTFSLSATPRDDITEALREVIPMLLQYENFARDIRLGSIYFHRLPHLERGSTIESSSLSVLKNVMIMPPALYLWSPLKISFEAFFEKTFNLINLLTPNFKVKFGVQNTGPLMLDVGIVSWKVVYPGGNGAIFSANSGTLRIKNVNQNDGITSAVFHGKMHVTNLFSPSGLKNMVSSVNRQMQRRKRSTANVRADHQSSRTQGESSTTASSTGAPVASNSLPNDHDTLEHDTVEGVSGSTQRQVYELQSSWFWWGQTRFVTNLTSQSAPWESWRKIKSQVLKRVLSVLDDLLFGFDLIIDVNDETSGEPIRWLNRNLSPFADYFRDREEAASFIIHTAKQFFTCALGSEGNVLPDQNWWTLAGLWKAKCRCQGDTCSLVSADRLQNRESK